MNSIYTQDQQQDQPRQRFVNRETDVDVPRQQAQIIALAWATVIALGSGSICSLICWWTGQPTIPTILLSALLATIAGAVSFVILYARNVTRFIIHQRRLLGALEQLTGLDIDKDGYVGEPPQTVRIEVVWKGENNNTLQMMWDDWPMRAEQVPLFARAILAGKTTESSYGGDGAILTRPQFTKTRDNVIARGWGRWRNEDDHSQGWELTAKGRALFSELAHLPHPAG